MSYDTDYFPKIEIEKIVELKNGQKVIYLRQDEGNFTAFVDVDGTVLHVSTGDFYNDPADPATTAEISQIVEDSIGKTAVKKRETKILSFSYTMSARAISAAIENRYGGYNPTYKVSAKSAAGVKYQKVVVDFDSLN